jgi:hypothetical protein
MTTLANPAGWLAGYMPDLPTPFDESGTVDLEAFARLCKRQIVAGVPAIVVCETAGEAYADADGARGHRPHRRRARAWSRPRHCRSRFEFHPSGHRVDAAR